MSELASPFSTGGGGPDFETHVLSYYLACTLVGAAARGLPDAISREVSSQALYRGEALDDILIRSDRGDGEAKLALQVRRDVTFGQQDAKFIDVMRRAWETFTADSFRAEVDRFGIVVGLYSKSVDEHYQSMLTWARHSAASADFLKRIDTPRVGSYPQRAFLLRVRTTLSQVSGRAITDDELWRFCRSFVLLHFDLQISGSRDAAHLELLLQHALNIDATGDATQLATALFRFASEMKLAAGSHSADTLRQMLGSRFALRPQRSVVADLRRLREHAGFILKDISTSVHGESLPRSAFVDEARAAIDARHIVALVGEPGCGKSGVLRLLLERESAEGTILLLSGDRLLGSGWQSFAQNHGLSSELADLLSAVGTSTTPSVFLDGVDRATTLDAQRVVNDLLRTLTEVNRGNPRPWTIVLTTRSQNLAHVQQWLALPPEQQVCTIDVPLLNDEEFLAVAGPHPSLQLLDTDERLRTLTRNLFMVSRLTDPRITAGLPKGHALSEVDVSNVWWNHLVKDGGPRGLARESALVQIGERVLANSASVPPLSAEAVHSLESDRIVSADLFGTVRLTHDLFEDWVLARALGRIENQLSDRLGQVAAPYRLYRAVRLFGSMLLEAGQLPRWRGFLQAIESEPALAAQWRQVFLSSPLLSVRAVELLDLISSCPEMTEIVGEV